MTSEKWSACHAVSPRYEGVVATALRRRAFRNLCNLGNASTQLRKLSRGARGGYNIARRAPAREGFRS